nr:small integral membrane protein 5 isoform X2 [Kogia breviceps]
MAASNLALEMRSIGERLLHKLQRLPQAEPVEIVAFSVLVIFTGKLGLPESPQRPWLFLASRRDETTVPATGLAEVARWSPRGGEEDARGGSQGIPPNPDMLLQETGVLGTRAQRCLWHPNPQMEGAKLCGPARGQSHLFPDSRVFLTTKPGLW